MPTIKFENGDLKTLDTIFGLPQKWIAGVCHVTFEGRKGEVLPIKEENGEIMAAWLMSSNIADESKPLSE